jgi:hypothetical protein
MDLGIVIVNWNVRDLLAACLDSVYADLAQSRLRAAVCVVDNGSSDGSVEMLRAQFPHTRLIESENRGMGAGNNIGLRALMDAYEPFALFILNPDTVIHAGALKTLTTFLRDHPCAGVAAPKLLNPDGSLQHAGFRFPGLRQAALDLFPPAGRWYRLVNSPFNGRYPEAWYARGAPFRVDHTLGAAFVARRTAIEACGLFDETFHMYCEEIDWQWRMARAGWERWLVPGAAVTHYGGQSTAQAAAQSLVHLWASRRRLYQRYYTFPLNALVAQLVLAAMRGRIRANRQRTQRGELPADERAEVNQAWREIMRLWQGRRVKTNSEQQTVISDQ